MSQQPSITQENNVATLGDRTKASKSTGKRLDEAREDRTQDEEFESQHSKERVQSAKDRKIRRLRTMDKRPGFDEGREQFHDNADLSSGEDTDGDDNEDARPNPEADPARDRSMDEELNYLIPQFLDPRCSDFDRERLRRSIDTKVKQMGEAGRYVGFTLMQANSKEARKCAEDYWAKLFTKTEAITKLENIRKRMIDYNLEMKNPESWAILEPKEFLEHARTYKEEDRMDWEATPNKSGINESFDFFGAVGEYCPHSPVAILGWKNGGGGQKLYVDVGPCVSGS